MDKKALAKAQLRLRVAEENAGNLRGAADYDTFSQRWYVFLHAAKGIYTTLEQGAKATPQARQWFGQKNQERKDDPLLRYITEARNDDEHGIEEGTERVPQSLRLGVGELGSDNILRDERGNTFIGCGTAIRIVGGHPGMTNLPRLRTLDGVPAKSVFQAESVVLKTVHDRSKRPYAPPDSHRGAALSKGDPYEASRLTVIYLTALLNEAASFCKP